MWKTVEARDTGSHWTLGRDDNGLPPEFVYLFVLGMIVIALTIRLKKSGILRLPYRQQWGGKPRAGSASKFPYDPRLKSGKPRPKSLADPAYQQSLVQRAAFRKRPLMNKSEYRVFTVIEDACRELDRGYRVMSQVSLGEVIEAHASSPQLKSDSHASINSKRLDIAVIDAAGYLVAAIEYQGTGHHMQNAFMRDAVKREALRKAGLTMIEVLPSDDSNHIRWLLLRQIAPERVPERA